MPRNGQKQVRIHQRIWRYLVGPTTQLSWQSNMSERRTSLRVRSINWKRAFNAAAGASGRGVVLRDRWRAIGMEWERMQRNNRISEAVYQCSTNVEFDEADSPAKRITRRAPRNASQRLATQDNIRHMETSTTSACTCRGQRQAWRLVQSLHKSAQGTSAFPENEYNKMEPRS